MTAAAPPRLLIVEDEAIIALDLQEQLTGLGYRIAGVCADGDAALRQVRLDPPDLVLMDIRLQGGSDGVDAAAAIGRGLQVPVVFLTSHTDAATVRRAAAAGAYGFLTKPFRVNELRAGIEVALAKAQLERELRRAASNEFLSRASHELRTPLNAVIGLAELLRLQPAAEAARVHDYAGHIGHAGQQLLAMVEKLLDLQRAAVGVLALELVPVALDTAAADVAAQLAPLAAARQVTLRIAAAPGVTARADAARLRRLLAELAGNAIQYNRPGGSARVDAEAAGGRVRITISDDGIGIGAEQLARLFALFERAGRERSTTPGVGLGLVVARMLAEQMGGTLALHSTPGQGTRVIVELPAA